MTPRIKIVKFIICIVLFIPSCKQTGQTEALNHLADEKSPYLQQHATNPIDWYPWGEEALQKAKSEDKLLAISIGYFSCHWCQVMEEETFTDTLVARVMNKDFVSIKVDREERPDVDAVYTAAAEAMIGNSGWPLNVIATPDGEPLFIGTYFENEEWLSIVERAAYLFDDNPDQLKADAKSLSNQISTETTTDNSEGFDPQYITQQLVNSFDAEMGGLNAEQKFPNAPLLNALLDYGYYYENESLNEQLRLYLNQLMYGGIRDHLNGGFFRYSTDRSWQIPHFEKMLYDNAQLIAVYSKAYRKWGDKKYLEVAESTFEFLSNELRNPNGGFYSSSNAVSENEEGRYYLFTTEEISEMQLSESTKSLFSFSDTGNWENQKNVLFTNSAQKEAYELWKTSDDFESMKAMQGSRDNPEIDQKTLTAWNAMVVTGLLNLYQANQKEDYLEEATSLMQHLIELRFNPADQSLVRQEGMTDVYFLEDYAFMIDALIELYQVTLEEGYLSLSKQLTEKANRLFHTSKGYQLSTEEQLQTSFAVQSNDLAIPSVNAQMAKNLHRLATYYYDMHGDWKNLAGQITQQEMGSINMNPAFKGTWLQNLLIQNHEPYEVAILGQNATELVQSFQSKAYRPDIIFLGGSSEGEIPLLENKLVSGRNMIYVCQNKTCRLPTQDLEVAYQLTLN